MNLPLTTSDLLDAMIDELNNLFAKDLFASQSGELVKLRHYPHDVPVAQDNEDDPAPYTLTRIHGGGDEEDDTVRMTIVVCLFDRTCDKQGYRDVLHVIGEIRRRFTENPMLGKAFERVGAMPWTLSDEDTYPYHFGGVELIFAVPSIELEEMT